MKLNQLSISFASSRQSSRSFHIHSTYVEQKETKSAAVIGAEQSRVAHTIFLHYFRSFFLSLLCPTAYLRCIFARNARRPQNDLAVNVHSRRPLEHVLTRDVQWVDVTDESLRTTRLFMSKWVSFGKQICRI